MTGTLQSISQIASAALVAGIWQGLLLTVAIGICVKLAPKTPAAIRFTTWMAVFFAIALLPVLAIFPGHHGAAALPPRAGIATHALELDPQWALGIAALWAILASARLMSLARNALRLRALWKRSIPLETSPSIQSMLVQAGFRQPKLCASRDVDQPCVIGFFAPRILVPGWLLEKATTAELEQIVRHELSHLRRFDDWTNLAQKLAMAVFPLNPALLWVERRLCAERELACDESVVRATRAPREYATCLTNLAEQRMTRRALALSGSLSLGAWERRSQLAGRIESILRGGTGLSPLKSRAVLAAFLIATAGGAIKLGRSAQLVSFAAPRDNQQVAFAASRESAGPGYRDVAFHTPTAPDKPVVRNAGISTRIAPSAKQTHLRTIAKNSARRATSPADGIQAFVIVTRWQDSSGQQTTVIHQFVRLSTSSAAPLPGGWFVVQL